jgi:hypothetical protein
VTVYATPRVVRDVPVRIRCLTAPTSRCRVDVRAYEVRTGKRLGRARTRIARGTRRIVRVAVGRAAAARLRKGELAMFIIRTIDPDGRINQIGPI